MANAPAEASPPAPPDTGTRLAYENVFLAQERTQLAWTQAGLAFITFGFSIAKAFQFLHESQGTHAPLLGARTVGILMVAVGLVALTCASVQHRKAIKAIRSRCPGLPLSHAGVLADLLAGLGIVALIAAFLRN
jgi:putative membrane protein